ncbi:hypothetical protein ASE37_21775 [Rhizobium sp. Root268]|nr:hypothetical protein ASC86_23205 [Rhizobium sp. Root1212]KRD35152.1 hypothetical protein ASE37_21775 [Rhizobium sp. Root268]
MEFGTPTGARIEVIAGVIHGFVREDKAGNFELVDCVAGTPCVFVEWVDAEGYRQGLYHGAEMHEAYRQAAIWQSIIGLPIYVPNTGGQN